MDTQLRAGGGAALGWMNSVPRIFVPPTSLQVWRVKLEPFFALAAVAFPNRDNRSAFCRTCRLFARNHMDARQEMRPYSTLTVALPAS
jgi:hypothetical protein